MVQYFSMKLTDEKDTARWETLKEFNIVKRDAIDLSGEKPHSTISGVYGDWNLDVTSSEKGSITQAVLVRFGEERYAFTQEADELSVSAEANNTNQDMSSMLHIAATIIKNPNVIWD